MTWRTFVKNSWGRFKKDLAIWVGVVAIVTGTVGTGVSVLTYHNVVAISESLNRPYLNVYSPQFVFFDEQGLEFDEGAQPDFDKLKFFKIVTKFVNSGNLPAERISIDTTSDPYVLEMDDTNRVVIYDEVNGESDLHPIEKLKNAFKNSSEFKIRMEVKYKAVGGNEIYTAFNESRCRATGVGTRTEVTIRIHCIYDQKGTN